MTKYPYTFNIVEVESMIDKEAAYKLFVELITIQEHYKQQRGHVLEKSDIDRVAKRTIEYLKIFEQHLKKTQI